MRLVIWAVLASTACGANLNARSPNRPPGTVLGDEIAIAPDGAHLAVWLDGKIWLGDIAARQLAVCAR
jgi:hypothetical protein